MTFSSDVLIYEVPTEGITMRIKLLRDQNLEVVDKVLEEIDRTGELQSTHGHVVISGDGIWLPTRIVYLGNGNMVPRAPGTVYLYAPGQTICLTYGGVTESSNVNMFAEVFEEDLPKLKQLGEIVYNKTIQTAQRSQVPVKIRRFGTQSPPGLLAPIVEATSTHKAQFNGHWKDAVALISAEIDRIWIAKPIDIQKVDFGISETGAGTGKQMFSVLVHLEAYTMMTGADIVYRFLKSSRDPGMTVSLLKRMTQDFLFKPFNIPEFMTDLGLENMHKFGEIYVTALDTVTTFEEYVELTGTMLTYITRYHRWIHHIFPWHLGSGFPHRSKKEFMAVMIAQSAAARRPRYNQVPIAGPQLLPILTTIDH